MAFEKKIWTNGGVATEEVPVPPAISADNLNRIEEGIDGALQKDGGIMTGRLILNDDPTASLQAATKHYVDKNIICFYGEFSFPKVNNASAALKLPDNIDLTKYSFALVGISSQKYQPSIVSFNESQSLQSQDWMGVFVEIKSDTREIIFSKSDAEKYTGSSFRIFLIPTASAIKLTQTSE